MGIFNQSKEVFPFGDVGNVLEGIRDSQLRAGTLILLDMAHSLNYPDDDTDVPVEGSVFTLRNIASYQASLLTGGDEEDMDCRIVSSFEAADIAFERTAKRGLHGACSRSGMSAGRNARIEAADAIKSYVFANPSHRYFMSVEGRTTRKALYSSGNALPLAGLFNEVGSSINYQMLFTSGDDAGTEMGANGGAEYGALNDPANPNTEGAEFYRDGSSFRWTNSAPSTAADLENFLALWGAYGAWSSVAQNKAASWIFRRFILEDLTVSGLGYDDASYLNRRLWQQNCGVGGRWHGDTYTAAATLKA